MREDAQIKSLDFAYRPASERQSWHNLEKPVEGDITSADQIPNVACPIILEPYPTPEGYILAAKGCSKQIVADHPVHGKVILGTFSDKYQTFSNLDIFNQIMEAFDKNSIPARLVFALTMRNLSVVSYSFEVKDASEFFAGGRPHKHYICGTGSHDGKNGVRIFGTTVNSLCSNTLRLAMKGEKLSLDYTFFHDKRGKGLFDELPRLVEASLLHVTAYSKLADKMANKALTLTQAQAIAIELLAKGESEISTRTVNASEEIARLFKHGIANNGDDLFDLTNAVTEFFTHGDGTGKTASMDKKLYSSDYGTGADKKAQFIAALQNKDGDLISDAELNEIAKRGEKLLLEYV